MSDLKYPLRGLDLKSTLLPDGYLVVKIESSNEAVTLNPLGAAVWEFCDGGHTIDDIVREMVELGVPATDNLAPDVSALIAELVAVGLLRWQEHGSS